MLYTDKIQDPKLAALIRGIPAKNHAPFVTPIMASDLIKDSALSFYTALPHEKGGLWDVKEMTAFPNGDDFDIQLKTIYSGIHFFDALFACAEKHALQTKMGKHEITDKDTQIKLFHHNVTPWQDMANESGQPLDNTGMPLPSGNGRILVDGMFTSQALKIADQTKDKPLVPIATSSPQILQGFNLPSATTSHEHMNALRQKTSNTAKFSRAVEFAEDALQTIHAYSGYNNFKIQFSNEYFSEETVKGLHLFGHALFYGGGAALALTSGFGWVAMPLAWRALQTVYRPHDHINIAFLMATTTAAMLPNGPEKTMIQEFNHLSRATYHLERAASNFDIYHHDHRKTGSLSRAVKQATKGLTMMDTPPEDIARVVAKMHEGHFPSTFHFYDLAYERFKEIRNVLKPLLSLEQK